MPLRTRASSAGLAGTLSVNATAGSNTLNVSESGSLTPDTVLVTNSQISSTLVPFAINYSTSGAARLPAASTWRPVRAATRWTSKARTRRSLHDQHGERQRHGQHIEQCPCPPGNLNSILGRSDLNTQGNGTATGDTLNISDLGYFVPVTYSVTKVLNTTHRPCGPRGIALITYDATLGAGQLEHFKLVGNSSGGNTYNINNTTATVSNTITDGNATDPGGSVFNVQADQLMAARQTR